MLIMRKSPGIIMQINKEKFSFLVGIITPVISECRVNIHEVEIRKI